MAGHCVSTLQERPPPPPPAPQSIVEIISFTPLPPLTPPPTPPPPARPPSPSSTSGTPVETTVVSFTLSLSSSGSFDRDSFALSTSQLLGIQGHEGGVNVEVSGSTKALACQPCAVAHISMCSDDAAIALVARIEALELSQVVAIFGREVTNVSEISRLASSIPPPPPPPAAGGLSAASVLLLVTGGIATCGLVLVALVLGRRRRRLWPSARNRRAMLAVSRYEREAALAAARQLPPPRPSPVRLTRPAGEVLPEMGGEIKLVESAVRPCLMHVGCPDPLARLLSRGPPTCLQTSPQLAAKRHPRAQAGAIARNRDAELMETVAEDASARERPPSMRRSFREHAARAPAPERTQVYIPAIRL